MEDFKSMLAEMWASTHVEDKLVVKQFDDTKSALSTLAIDNI